MKSTMTAIGAALAAMLIGAPAVGQPYGHNNMPQMPQVTEQQSASQQEARQQPTQQGPVSADPTHLKTHVPKVSHDAAKAIGVLQSAVNANNSAAIPAALAAAQAAAKTPADRYIIALLQLKSAAAAKNDAAITAGLEAMLASGDVAADEQFSVYYNLGTEYANAKQYDRAAAAFQKATALSPNNVDAIAGLAEADIHSGKVQAAIPLLQQGIRAQEAGGQKAPEAWYKRAVSVAYDAKLPVAADLARQWLAAYPSPESWRNSIAIYRNLEHPDTEATLDLLRLESLVGALQTPGDYDLYATSAAAQSNYNEAQAVIDKGIATKVVNPSDPEFAQIISGLKAKTMATDATLAEATPMAKQASAIVRIGDRYVVMGEYAKAENAYKLALSKPGADPNLINLHMGMALARQGDKAGATAALKAVSGPLSGVASYWLTYVASKA